MGKPTVEGDNPPLCVLFRHRSESSLIDGALEKTDGPVITCPSCSDWGKMADSTYQSFDMGYNPPVAMVLGPGNGALFAAEIVGLYHDGVREAVAAYKKIQKNIFDST